MLEKSRGSGNDTVATAGWQVTGENFEYAIAVCRARVTSGLKHGELIAICEQGRGVKHRFSLPALKEPAVRLIS